MIGGELPLGWVEVRIDEVCAVNPRDPNPPDDTNVSFVPMAAVCEVNGAIERAEVRTVSEVKKGFTSFANGDVIFAKITPCMENGKSAVAASLLNGRAYGSTEFFVLRSSGAVAPHYLHQFVRQESYRRQARTTMQSGVGQARVPKDFVEATPLPLPPLPEQRRIVARLDELRARSRKAREALDEVPALLDKLKQSVLAAAFRGDLTAEWRAAHPDVEPASVLLDRIRAERRKRWEQANPKKRYVEPEAVAPHLASSLPALPPSWEWASIDELTNPEFPLCYGVVQPGEDDGGVPLVRVCDINDHGTISINQLRRVSRPIDEQYARSRVFGGEVLITVVGTIGRVAVVPKEIAGSNIARAVARVTLLNGVSPEWAAFALRSPKIAETLTRESREVARKTLNIGDLAGVPVPVAPAAEMAEAIKIIARALPAAAGSHSVVEGLSQLISSLDQSILAKAFRGELVPQDPTDEPADKLLARIKAGAPPASKAGRGRKARDSA